MIGTTLSHYRITKKLGAGGMGEVYRADDTNLDRRVAIKVLPDIFSGDPERLARFEREAKLLACGRSPKEDLGKLGVPNENTALFHSDYEGYESYGGVRLHNSPGRNMFVLFSGRSASGGYRRASSLY